MPRSAPRGFIHPTHNRSCVACSMRFRAPSFRFTSRVSCTAKLIIILHFVLGRLRGFGPAIHDNLLRVPSKITSVKSSVKRRWANWLLFVSTVDVLFDNTGNLSPFGQKTYGTTCFDKNIRTKFDTSPTTHRKKEQNNGSTRANSPSGTHGQDD